MPDADAQQRVDAVGQHLHRGEEEQRAPAHGHPARPPAPPRRAAAGPRGRLWGWLSGFYATPTIGPLASVKSMLLIRSSVVLC